MHCKFWTKVSTWAGTQRKLFKSRHVYIERNLTCNIPWPYYGSIKLKAVFGSTFLGCTICLQLMWNVFSDPLHTRFESYIPFRISIEFLVNKDITTQTKYSRFNYDNFLRNYAIHQFRKFKENFTSSFDALFNKISPLVRRSYFIQTKDMKY